MGASLTECKLTVLFMLEQTERGLTYSRISEYLLSDEDTDYFMLQQALGELKDSGLIAGNTVSNTTCYHITGEGRNTFALLSGELPDRRKQKILKDMEESGMTSGSTLLSPADFYISENGSCTVRLRLVERNRTIMELSLSCPGKEAARKICEDWPFKSRSVYEKIFEELL